MRRPTRWLCAGLLVLLVAACGGPRFREPAIPGMAGGQGKVGRPYKVAGIWYRPKADPTYDRTGIASWYGRDFHGRRTANGERYNMNALTAAHTTLPLPSLVRVTNLGNGRSLVLRINDRGPFARGRIIDVSRRAAQLLGFEKRGVARVRVQVVGRDGRPPARHARRQTASHQTASRQPVGDRSRPGLSPGQGRRTPIPTGAPPPPETRTVPPVMQSASPRINREAVRIEAVSPNSLFVHAGSYTDPANAARAAAAIGRVGPLRISKFETGGKLFYRVRIGPLATVEDADKALGAVIAGGHPDARIIVE